MTYLREYCDIFVSLLLPFKPLDLLRLQFRAHFVVLAFAAIAAYAPLVVGFYMLVRAYCGITLQYDSEEFLRAVLIGVEFIFAHVVVLGIFSIFVVGHRNHLRAQSNVLLARTLRATPRLKRSAE